MATVYTAQILYLLTCRIYSIQTLFELWNLQEEKVFNDTIFMQYTKRPQMHAQNGAIMMQSTKQKNLCVKLYLEQKYS